MVLLVDLSRVTITARKPICSFYCIWRVFYLRSESPIWLAKLIMKQKHQLEMFSSWENPFLRP